MIGFGQQLCLFGLLLCLFVSAGAFVSVALVLRGLYCVVVVVSVTQENPWMVILNAITAHTVTMFLARSRCQSQTHAHAHRQMEGKKEEILATQSQIESLRAQGDFLKESILDSQVCAQPDPLL